MVLYTPLSHHDIFRQDEQALELLSYKGRSLYARKNVQGEYELVQLVSTNPKDYLDNELTPGSVLASEFVQMSK